MTQKDNVGIALPPEQIEAALRESEQRLRWLASIIDSSDDAIVSKNLDGVITSWNGGAERIFGYSAREAIGQPITLVIPQDRQGEEREILTRIRRGERVDHFETIRQRKNGVLIVVSLTISPVKDAGGRIVGASKIARDITEQKKNQELIVTLAREAEHRSKNLLATVRAIVSLSHSDTAEGLKQAVAGRIQQIVDGWAADHLKRLAHGRVTGTLALAGQQPRRFAESLEEMVHAAHSLVAFAFGQRAGQLRRAQPVTSTRCRN